MWQHWGERGRVPIAAPLPVAPGEPELNGDQEAMDVIRSVWNGYGGMDGGALSGLTHRAGSPWSQTYGLQDNLIPDEITREYYTRLARSA